MSLRISLFLTLALLLTACGFEPLYGEKGPNSNSQVLAGVQVDSIGGRSGQEFKAHLEDQLNPGGAIPPNPPYRLNATLTTSIAAIGVARDGTVSRYNIYLDSRYVLYRNSDGKAITSGSVRHVSSYNNVTNAYFSTFISEQDATRRGIEELSEIYRQRLAVYLDAGAQEDKLIKSNTTPVPTPLQPLPGQMLPGQTLPGQSINGVNNGFSRTPY